VDLKEMECGGIDRIQVAQDRIHWQSLVKTVINFGVP
jgi:hypothetical protein